jgi:parallel beta-helix repeat protein
MKPSLILAVLAAATTFAAAQGSLTPPPGAPAPVMKTLDQVEPRTDLQNAPAAAVNKADPNYEYVINQSGSYYLSGEIIASKAGAVLINAAGVTLDLNGFRISRGATTGRGVSIGAAADNSLVRNGTIRGFDYGVYTDSSGGNYPKNCTVSHLRVSGSAGGGIFMGGAALIENCLVTQVSGTGMNIGIYGGPGSNIQRCVAGENTVHYAIYGGDGSAISDCTSYKNNCNFGIIAAQGSVLSNCNASYNTGNLGSSRGIFVSNNARAFNCVATGNTSSVTLTSSTGIGIDGATGSTIESCRANSNSGDGIRVSADCVVIGSSASLNGPSSADAAGIHATGQGNRIENNSVNGNDRGIDVDDIRNMVFRNTAKANGTNFDIVPNNVCGAVMNRTAPASAAILGNSGASSTGTTDPLANFAH